MDFAFGFYCALCGVAAVALREEHPVWALVYAEMAVFAVIVAAVT